MAAPLLTRENYAKGFLIDEEWMAGIAEAPERPGEFMAYVMRHTTGEYLGVHSYKELDRALEALNRMNRAWNFESAHVCGGGKCGKGNCKGGGCGEGPKAEGGGCCPS